jgi:uncharacterized RDD family membrane protein YckC
MMNDSVREELETKISNPSKPLASPRPASAMPVKRAFTPEPVVAQREAPALLPPAKLNTTDLRVKKTSPTLVGFQPKAPTVPDWRLQLQNSIRGRKVGGDGVKAPAATFKKQLVTTGANALKAEYIEETAAEAAPEHKDPRVAKALERIANSRKTFLSPPVSNGTPAEPPPAAGKSFRFNVVAPNADAPAVTVETKARVNVVPKPRLVPAPKSGYDTNKLPKLAEPEAPVNSIEMPIVPEVFMEPAPMHVSVASAAAADVVAYAENIVDESPETEEFDDLAPFSMRFNAGIFDLIIGSFISLALLSPLAFISENWLSTSGLITFVATCSIVMFFYLTICLGLFGRTVGMRMFSLELVDADENDYPTFHQAAVSSAAYLLSLPLGGIGFLTVFFNDEKRAAHDLLSGTIIVTEF